MPATIYFLKTDFFFSLMIPTKTAILAYRLSTIAYILLKSKYYFKKIELILCHVDHHIPIGYGILKE